MHPDRAIEFVDRAEHGHLPKTNQKFTDANKANSHRSPRLCWRKQPPDSQGPCPAPAIVNPRSTSPSDPKNPFSGDTGRCRAPDPRCRDFASRGIRQRHGWCGWIVGRAMSVTEWFGPRMRSPIGDRIQTALMVRVGSGGPSA